MAFDGMGWFQYWRVNSKCPSWLSKSKFMMKSSSSTNCSIIRSSMFTRILKEREKNQGEYFKHKCIYNKFIFLFSFWVTWYAINNCYWNTVNDRNVLIIKSLEFKVPFSLRDIDQNRCCVNGGVTETQKFVTKRKLKTSAFQCF